MACDKDQSLFLDSVLKTCHSCLNNGRYRDLAEQKCNPCHQTCKYNSNNSNSYLKLGKTCSGKLETECMECKAGLFKDEVLNTCVSCDKDGEFIDGDSCRKCHPTCIQFTLTLLGRNCFSKSSESCLKCYPDGFLNKNSECVPCRKDGLWIDGRECRDCHPLCKKISSAVES